jgi:hypothetical protein
MENDWRLLETHRERERETEEKGRNEGRKMGLEKDCTVKRKNTPKEEGP